MRWMKPKPRSGTRLAAVGAAAVVALTMVGLSAGSATAAPTAATVATVASAATHDQQLETARAYAVAANPGASVVFAGAQVVKPSTENKYEFVFMVDGTTRYGVSLKGDGGLGWKSSVPNCLFPVPCETLPVETWVSSPADAVAAIARTDARFAGDVTTILYGKNPEATQYHGNPTYYVTSTMVGYQGTHTWRYDPVSQMIGLPF